MFFKQDLKSMYLSFSQRWRNSWAILSVEANIQEVGFYD